MALTTRTFTIFYTPLHIVDFWRGRKIGEPEKTLIIMNWTPTRSLLFRSLLISVSISSVGKSGRLLKKMKKKKRKTKTKGNHSSTCLQNHSTQTTTRKRQSASYQRWIVQANQKVRIPRVTMVTKK